MQKEIVYILTTNFESHAHQTDDGVEYWLARDLQALLGYGKWENFQNVVSKSQGIKWQTILPTPGKWLP